MDGERIVLGSGYFYIMEFKKDTTIPGNTEIEKEENMLGLIQGGATLEYKPTKYTAKDDMGRASKTILMEEEVTFKTGIMTWCGKTLEKLCETARVEEEGNMRIVRIGGVGTATGKMYILHFLHKDKIDGDIRITIVGNNEAGFSFAFAKDKETVLDAEFKALPMDEDGTLIIFQEEIPSKVEEPGEMAETLPEA